MIAPYLTFYGNCKEALEFYQGVFKCTPRMSQPYGDYIPEGLTEVPPHLKEWVLHAELEIGETVVWFADEAVEPAVTGNNVKLVMTTETKKEAERIFNSLNDDARVILPPTQTFYSSFHAEIIDKYGIIWNIVAKEC